MNDPKISFANGELYTNAGRLFSRWRIKASQILKAYHEFRDHDM